MPDIEATNGTVKKERAYFAASNSYKGFISYFDAIFRREDVSHVYVVQGGPGTGKSRFIREVAEGAEAIGEEVEYYYCSSDQSSLDGIMIIRDGGNIALVDGTLPHPYEIRRAGVSEEIVNLGAFWDASKLSDFGEEIKDCHRAKGERYASAYGYLSTSHSIKENADRIIFQGIRSEDIEKYALKVMREIGHGDGRAIPALIDSVGALGEVRYDSFIPFAERVIYVDDSLGASAPLFSSLLRNALRKEASVRVSYDPIEPCEINGLFLNGGELAIVRGDGDFGITSNCKPTEVVSAKDFLDREEIKKHRPLLRHLKEARRSFISLALSELELAGQIHFELEGIYISAMDFERKERFSEEFRGGLF